jgi:hypothetical protein
VDGKVSRLPRGVAFGLVAGRQADTRDQAILGADRLRAGRFAIVTAVRTSRLYELLAAS